MPKFRNKVVLITGSGKGSGRILAQAFAQQGAIDAANDISPINVDEVVNQINTKGGRAKAYLEDVTKKVGAQNIIKQVEDDEAAFLSSMNGLEGLARQAARELSPYGIQVYSVATISEKIVTRVFVLFDLQTEEQ